MIGFSSRFTNSEKKEQTIVVGGNPPKDLKNGFGKWAKSVDDRPMPVKITISKLVEVAGNVIDPFTYEKMLAEYV